MRVLLITPPPFVAAAPAAASAVLTGWLRRWGHEAYCFDASRLAFERLLRREPLQRSYETCRAAGVRLTNYDESVPDFVAEAIATIRSSEATDDFGSYRSAITTLERAMWIHARAHGAPEWSSVDYRGDHERNDPADLCDAVERGGEVFDEPIDAAVTTIADFRPELICLSVSFPEQWYGALRLARKAKRACPETHITLGGATPSRVADQIGAFARLFDFVDSVIPREGELPLLALTRALQANRDPMSSVTGCLVRRDGQVRSSSALLTRTDPIALEDVPAPVFDDLLPGPYLSPGLMIPTSSTRACYFGKCTFCAIPRHFDRYRGMSAEQMHAQVVTLQQRHPNAAFKDVSEAILPNVAHMYADLAGRTGSPAPWEAYLRFERQFSTMDSARRLAAGGLKVAYFGLETGDQDAGNALEKRVNVDMAAETLRNFTEAGIWCHLFLISGFPGETEANHRATLGFLREHGGHIHSIQASAFRLEVGSPAVEELNKYGASRVQSQAPSFAVEVALSQRGSIPPTEEARRRVDEIRAVAYDASQTNDTLAASPGVWDAHKIFFVTAHAGPRLLAAKRRQVSITRLD